jgi:hypothetical protein
LSLFDAEEPALHVVTLSQLAAAYEIELAADLRESLPDSPEAGDSEEAIAFRRQWADDEVARFVRAADRIGCKIYLSSIRPPSESVPDRGQVPGPGRRRRQKQK